MDVNAHPSTAPPLTRRMLAPVGTLAATVAAFAVVGTVDPNEPGHYPGCPLLLATGIYCPGCGGLRTAYALVHGRFAEALALNVFAVLAIAAFAVFLAVWLYRAVRARRTTVPLTSTHWWLIGSAALLFTVVRNLPFGAALAP